MNYKAFGIIALMTVFVLSSCKKYEEGPLISFKSKKERVANTWKVEKAFHNDENATDQYDQYTLELKKDGFARLVASYNWGDFSFDYKTEGTWEFSGDQEKLEFDFEDDSADRIYHILKLKEESLWLREKGDDIELHLKPE